MKKNIVLTCDIGNSCIDFGCFREGHLVASSETPTSRISKNKIQDICDAVENLINKQAGSVKAIAICSVVPQKTPLVVQALSRYVDKKVLVAGKNLTIPITNLYHKPREVGQDRLVNAIGCKNLYGAPAIIADIGTALTIDILTKRGEYAGGAIFPGPSISAQALFQKTALLPMVKPEKPQRLIGKETVTSIQSGLYYGTADMIAGMIARIKTACPSLKTAHLIATGGFAVVLKKHLPQGMHLDQHLTLKSLHILANQAT
ncbi:MAG: type III pantothenate kinase [Candidatus Omnitrophica bacterium]|nr:type III pantothenate kinase [Candidatus Omnitrophota bacterium]